MIDKETEVDSSFETKHITENLLLESTRRFIGEIDQIPPIYSAVNVQGVRAYTYARNQEEVKLSARKVQIKTFEITKIELPMIQFRIVCSKGTYVRSLARDYGKALNSGAYLTELVRTRIGSFDVTEAISIEEFTQNLNELSQDI